MSIRVVAGLLAAVLLFPGCGKDATGTPNPPGGNNNNPPGGNNNPPPDPVTAASTAVATSLGAMSLSQGSDLVFNVVADIGDSWRFVLHQGNTFTIAIASTRFGLTNVSGALTKSTSADGAVDTYVSTTPSATFDVAVDKRTKILSGVANLKGNAASVAGSGYGTPNFAAAAGTYVFASFTYLTGTKTNAESSWGTLRVAGDGTMTMCTHGQINATGNCAAIVNGLAPTRLAGLTPSTYTGGRVQLRNGAADFGIALLQAGDRGASIVIDRNGPDTSDPSKTRVGTIFAVLQKALTGSEGNGVWNCSREGNAGLQAEVSGSSARIKEFDSGDEYRETLQFNKVKTGVSTTADLVGLVNSHYNGDGTAGDPPTNAHVLAMSSSMFVVGGEGIPAGRPLLCSRR